MTGRYFVLTLLGLVLLGRPAPAFDKRGETGTFRFEPTQDEAAGVAPRFRMPTRDFDYKLTPRYEIPVTGVRVFDLTFPSPVRSEVPENNTVHCELYLPAGPGPFPAAVVLDILQGNALVARAKSLWLAHHGVAGLIVYMAHYGPRRSPNGKERLISTDISRTIEGVRQTILDCRTAVAWLASRPEFDSNNLGVVGTSLGSMVGAILAANEPRVRNVCLLLGGGGLVDAYYDHPAAKPFRPLFDAVGGKFTLKLLLAPVDPITYARRLRGKNVLMVCASRDDIVPPEAGRALWEAAGKPKIVWVDATHVGAAVYFPAILRDVTVYLRGKSLP